MHALIRPGITGEPRLLGGEAEEGRQPGSEAIEQRIQNGTGGAAPGASGESQ